jgi:hypothetical protein
MRVDELLGRALGQVGQGTRYLLGGGRTQGPDPRSENGGCDCSAFTCWALDLRKYQPQLAWLQPVSGGWFNTNGIWWDAVREKTGFFEQIPAPLPGCVVVYPSALLTGGAGPKIGHVGVVSQVTSTGWRTVHCSSGNFKSTGDAIRETGPNVFLIRKHAVFAWPAMIERPISA